MRDFISTTTMLNEFIDCRMLRLSLEYHGLSMEQQTALRLECYNHMQGFLGDAFVTTWKSDNRVIKQSDLLTKLRGSIRTVDFWMRGQVVSDRVYNKKTFNAYKRWILYGDYWTTGVETSVSNDYFEIFRALYADAKTPCDIKRATLDLFGRKNMKAIAKWRGHDASGHFTVGTHRYDTSLYFGTYELCVAIVCLGSSVEEVSKEFSSFAEKMALMFHGISARVSLTPLRGLHYHTAYTEFFGGWNVEIPPDQKEKGVQPYEWHYYCYVPGVEWFNILSPWQRTHVPNLPKDAERENCVAIKEITGGGVIVRSSKSILATDIGEYAALKRVLYDALYPGGTEIAFVHLLNIKEYSPAVKPRIMWERIPVFDHEISALEDRLVFQHKKV